MELWKRIRNEGKGYTKSKIFTSFELNYLIKYSLTSANEAAAAETGLPLIIVNDNEMLKVFSDGNEFVVK